MLACVLSGIIAQAENPAFAVEIVVVDNDRSQSARDVVHRNQRNRTCRIVYDCEPEQSIALARNRAISNASGDFIATIDDDEFPAVDWLSRAHSYLKESPADGILGPVIPHFPPGVPQWLVKSGLCVRARHASGSRIALRDMRTGNTLFRRSIFIPSGIWFDPSCGRGGEDGDFMTRIVEKGHRLVWCDEAVVYETVTPDRWTARYYLRRYFTIGTMVGNYYRRRRDWRPMVKESLLLAGAIVLMLISLPMGKPVWVRVATKAAYHCGCVLAFLKLWTSLRKC